MILSARLHKIGGDVRASRSRTALVALSIAVGVAAVGTVVGARSLMLRSLDESRDEAAFPSATLLTEPFVPPVVAAVRRVPGVAGVEARRVVGAQVRVHGKWRDLTITAPADFDAVRIGRITPARGRWPPPTGTMLVERSSLASLERPIGGAVRVRLASGARRWVRVAGSVHDLNVPSTRTSGVLYGYVTRTTLRLLGDERGPNTLLLRVAGDRRAAERAAARVRALLLQHRIEVRSTVVPKPGTFWAADAVRAMVLLLTVLAVVCLFTSTFLVVNIVSSLVAQQTRQVGVMKAIGARAAQTAALYLATAGAYGAAALVIAVPVAAVGALALVTYSAGLINLDVAGFSLPAHVLGLELVAGLVLPVFAALAPVMAASKATVREAIASQGLGDAGSALSGTLAERASRVPVAMRLALTNILRRKRRMLLTTATLALGGAVFIGVLSVRASLLGTLDTAAQYRAYDVDIGLDRAYPAGRLERAAGDVRGVTRAEAWSVEGAYRVRPDSSQSQTFSVVGAPAGTTLLRPQLTRGRSLRLGDGRAVVVNTDVLESEPGLRPGDSIRLAVNGRRPTRWQIVGIARRVVAGPVIYANQAPLAHAGGEDGLARRLVVVTRDHSDAAQGRVASALTARLQQDGFRIASARTSNDLQSLDRKNFGIIVSFLLAMAVLLALVGGLGVTGLLSITVVERSREIGVLRAIGAHTGDVARLVVVEGVVVAVLAVALAAPLALPVGLGLSDAVGRLFLGAPLAYSYSVGGALAWLGLALVLGVAASLLPARRAARLTVRAVLAYE